MIRYEKIILYVAILLATLSSCNRDFPSVEEGSPATLYIEAKSTKAVGDVLGSEETIQSVHGLTFLPNGLVDGEAFSDRLQFSIECTSGERDVFIFANTGKSLLGASQQELLNKRLYLSDEKPYAFKMSQMRRIQIHALSNVISARLARYVSKVDVLRVRYRMVDNALAERPFTLSSIYLTNINGSIALNGVSTVDIWHNRLKYSGELSSLTRENINLVMTSGSEVMTRFGLYMYPNPVETDSFDKDIWCPRHSRVVFEAISGSQTYYYPVTLPVIKRNSSYRFSDVLIARAGSLHPEDPLSYISVSFGEPTIDEMGSEEGVLDFTTEKCNLLFLADGVNPFDYIGDDVIIGNKPFFITFSDGTVSPFGIEDHKLNIGASSGVIIFKNGTIEAFKEIPTGIDISTIKKVILFDASLKGFFEDEWNVTVNCSNAVLMLSEGAVDAFRETLKEVLVSQMFPGLVLVPESQVEAFREFTEEIHFNGISENIVIIKNNGIIRSWESTNNDIEVVI